MFHCCLSFLAIGKLPPTLHNQSDAAALSYSKVSRGLHFPLEIPGFYTRKEYSEGSNWGQWEPRYATRASRHSIDKVLRYLKRVIVTPAVYWLLAQLKPSLKYQHWAGVTDYTHPYGLAVS